MNLEEVRRENQSLKEEVDFQKEKGGALFKENIRLEKEVELLKGECYIKTNLGYDLIKENDQLKEKLEIAKKALEIYANRELTFNGNPMPNGGEYAQEALNQLKEEDGK